MGLHRSNNPPDCVRVLILGLLKRLSGNYPVHATKKFSRLQAMHAIVSINLIRRTFQESMLRKSFMPDQHHMTIISDFLRSVWLVTSCHQVIFVAFHRCSVNGGVVSRQSAFAWHFHHLNICFFSFHIEMVR